MNITKAERKDLDTIRTLAAASWRKNYINIISMEQIEYMLNKMYSVQELNQHFDHPDYHYYLIKDQNPIGFMGFECNYDGSTTKLHRLYLLSEEKGKGFGKLAIDLLKTVVKEQENNRIILNVNKENPARFFYESQGFTIYDEGVFDFGGGYFMDDFLMEYIVL